MLTELLIDFSLPQAQSSGCVQFPKHKAEGDALGNRDWTELENKVDIYWKAFRVHLGQDKSLHPRWTQNGHKWMTDHEVLHFYKFWSIAYWGLIVQLQLQVVRFLLVPPCSSPLFMLLGLKVVLLVLGLQQERICFVSLLCEESSLTLNVRLRTAPPGCRESEKHET